MDCAGTERASGGPVKSTEGDSPEDKKHHARPYQLELVDYALKQNTIVNLGTGAGKTFVAVMVIKELAYQTRDDFTVEKGRRTVFLAHTGMVRAVLGTCVRILTCSYGVW